jgi:hypothetical protein
VLTRPRILLHLEGGVVLAVSLLLYWEIKASWILFAILILLPDIAMLGYLVNIRIGTALYNLVHTFTGPLVLLGLSDFCDQTWMIPYGLVWTAHIGMDRMLGFGLKYPTQFRDTHLQRL